MSFPLPPLVVARQPRTTELAWDHAPSWFGGRPRLGSLSWPRDAKTGKPLIFIAQIDLAEVARYAPDFPAQGSLAFFLGSLGSCDGAVVSVPMGSSGRRTEPPSDAHPVREIASWPFHDDPGPGVEYLFPYWPLQLKPLDIEIPCLDQDEFDSEPMTRAAVSALDGLFPNRGGLPSPKEVAALCGDTPVPHWWHSAHTFAACMQNALYHAPEKLRARAPYLERARADFAKLMQKNKPKFAVFGRRAAEPSPEWDKARQNLERLEAQDAAYHRDLPKFAALVEDAVAFAADRKPTDIMLMTDWQSLVGRFERARGDFEDLARYALPYMGDIERMTLLSMLTADHASSLTAPQTVRAYVNSRCLLPSSGSWHQMFGVGVDIQGAAVWDNADKHLLLQLVYDETMHWRFGDVGAFQFWISPQDVKARNWSAACLTFECH